MNTKLVSISLILLITILTVIMILKLREQDLPTNIEVSAPTAINHSEDTSEEMPDRATYQIKFVATWDQASHPDNYPNGAHFSPLVAYTHSPNPDSAIFSLDALASPGIKQMAETGITDLLATEIQSLIDNQLAHQYRQSERLESPGEITLQIETTKTLSHLTLVSMIAPSPDWFVSIDLNLIENNQWIDDQKIELTSLDAGTDSGGALLSENQPSTPQEVIRQTSEGFQNMGYIEISRQQ